MEVFYAVAKQGRRRKDLVILALDNSQANTLLSIWAERFPEWEVEAPHYIPVGKPGVFEVGVKEGFTFTNRVV